MSHPFIKTIGHGPYRLVDFFQLIIPSEHNQGRNNFNMAPKNLKSGVGTCAHCGHGIIYNYIIENGLGERFAVGSECVEKCGNSVEFKNFSAFEKHRIEIKRKQNKDRKENQRILLKENLINLVRINSKKLEKIKYENFYSNNALDYCLWYISVDRSIGSYKIFQKKLLNWGIE